MPKAVKRLYLEQTLISLDELPDEQRTRENLQDMRGNWPKKYRVKKVVGSTTPQVNQELTKEQTDAYCADESWQVEIT